MATTAREIVWLHSFVQDLGITILIPMHIHGDNKVTIFIAENLAFHCHFIRDKVLMRVISTPHVSSSDQLTNIFTKSIIGVSYDCLGSKLSKFDIYSLA